MAIAIHRHPRHRYGRRNSSPASPSLRCIGIRGTVDVAGIVIAIPPSAGPARYIVSAISPHHAG
jgi:hypothetical protein